MPDKKLDLTQTLKIEIVNPDKVVYEGEGSRVFVPGPDFEMALLPYHTPMYAELGKGTVRIEQTSGGQETHDIESGIVRIKNNKIVILIGF
jgi:F-type H+-transporting ATPase subunit epsilon